MTAIYKRELRSYFCAPLGYIFCGVFLAASGLIFALSTVRSATTDISGYFSIMIFAFIILLPLLTMRSFSEERKTKTDQILLTSPVSITKIVFAKYLSALTVFAANLALTLIYFLPLSKYGDVNMAKAAGSMVAMLLIGMTFIAIGIFVSSLTENQVVAVAATIGVLIVLVLVSWFNSLIDTYWIRSVLSWISVYGRYQNFSYGIFDFSALLYYLSLSAVFVFLTVKVQQRRRWA